MNKLYSTGSTVNSRKRLSSCRRRRHQWTYSVSPLVAYKKAGIAVFFIYLISLTFTIERHNCTESPMNGLIELHRQWTMLSSVVEQIPIQKLELIEHLRSLISEDDDQTFMQISELLRNQYQLDIDHRTIRLLSTMFGTSIPNFYTPGSHIEIINSFALTNNTPFFSTIHLSSCYNKCILCDSNLRKYTLSVRTTAEFDSVIVGCDKTPKPGVDSCDEHRDRRHVSIMSEDEDCIDND
ncbi:unnamed protein product, partial [Rotaria magnacalcarata]